jgi:ABC-type branched-subunit amino acid transport system substrate-binding protein
VWPHSLAADAAKTIAANGGTVVGQTFVPLGTSDFSSVVSKIKAANPDLIFAPLVGGDAVAFVKTAASFGLKAPYLTELMEEDTVAGIGAKADAGLNTALSYFQGLATPENQKYLAAYHAMFGASAPPQNSLSESVYEAINMWALAAEKAGSIDTSKVAAALPGISWDGPRGQVTMGSDHHVTQHMYLAAAQPDATLKVVHDFGEIAPATCGS